MHFFEVRILDKHFKDALVAAKLVQPWPLRMKRGEQNIPVTGLYRIDEAALNALGNKTFLALRRSGALTVAYAQLLSMNQMGVLQRLFQIQAKLRAPTPSVVKNAQG